MGSSFTRSQVSPSVLREMEQETCLVEWRVLLVPAPCSAQINIQSLRTYTFLDVPNTPLYLLIRLPFVVSIAAAAWSRARCCLRAARTDVCRDSHSGKRTSPDSRRFLSCAFLSGYNLLYPWENCLPEIHQTEVQTALPLCLCGLPVVISVLLLLLLFLSSSSWSKRDELTTLPIYLPPL